MRYIQDFSRRSSRESRAWISAARRALAEIIEYSPPRFAVGVFDDWGSGKTTLMHYIRSPVAERNNIVLVWFNAWRYERKDHLIVPMLDVLRDAIKRWADSDGTEDEKKSASVSAAATIGRATFTLLAGFELSGNIDGLGVDLYPSNVVQKSKDSDDEAADSPLSFYHASFRAMNDAVGDFSTQAA